MFEWWDFTVLSATDYKEQPELLPLFVTAAESSFRRHRLSSILQDEPH